MVLGWQGTEVSKPGGCKEKNKAIIFMEHLFWVVGTWRGRRIMDLFY